MIGYICNNNLDFDLLYNKNDSSSFYRKSTGKITYPKYEGGFYAQDSFSFYTSLEMNNKNQITLNNISFIYMPKNEDSNDKICGVMGLSLHYINYVEEKNNIINNLHKLNAINNYAFSIHYKKNDEGFIIIGEEPHIVMPDLFNENNLRRTNALSEGYDSIEWKTEFSQIYFYINGEKKKLTETKMGKFAIENNYIVGTNNYKKNIINYFFEPFLEKNICIYEKIQNQRYSAFICKNDPSFDISSFPSIYFYHRIFNYTFELTKKDLFLKIKDKYLFLVFFSDYDIKYFSLGKIFIKKYPLTFNQDKKTIGFYNSNLKYELNYEKDNNMSLKIVGIFIIILCCILGFFLAKKIYEQTRKRRINELNEQYEYNSYEKNNINYESNNKNKIFLEMPSK